MGGIVRSDNNETTILGNDVIDPHEAQQDFELVEANLGGAKRKRQAIEANLALRQARIQVEVANVNTYKLSH